MSNADMVNEAKLLSDNTMTDVGEDFSQLRTLDGLRAIDLWTIDADEGLLDYLEGFSNRFFGRMKEVQNKVDDLVFETKVSEANLLNTFNEFIMLSNTQFIENRIEDEDPTLKKTEQVPDVPSNKPSEDQGSKNYVTAIKHGLMALEACSVPLDEDDYNNDEYDEDDYNAEAEASEMIGGTSRLDDEQKKQRQNMMNSIQVTSSYVAQAASFKQRTLPFIIGSPEFLSDDRAGLNLEEEDAEIKVADEHITLEPASPSNNDAAPTPSGIPPPPPPPPPPPMMMSNKPPPPPLPATKPDLMSQRTDSIFLEKEDNLFVDDEEEQNKPEAAPMDIRAALNAALLNRNRANSDGSKSEASEGTNTADDVPDQSSTYQNVNKADIKVDTKVDKDDIFSVREDDLFSFKSTNTPTSKKQDEFDLSRLEQEISIGTTSPTKKVNISDALLGGPSKPKSSGLFADEDDFSAKPKEKARNERSKTMIETSKVGSIFGDEDDLFAPTQTVSKTKTLTPSTTKVIKSELFDDIDDDDFLSSLSTANNRKVQKKQEKNEQMKSKVSDLMDDLDLDKKAVESEYVNTKPTSLPVTQVEQSKPESKLFQDDLIDTATAAATTIKEEPKPTPPPSTTKPTRTKSVFFQDEEDDILGQLNQQPKQTQEKSAPAPKPTVTKKSLFDDGDDVDDILAPTKPSTATQPEPKIKTRKNSNLSEKFGGMDMSSLIGGLNKNISVGVKAPPLVKKTPAPTLETEQLSSSYETTESPLSTRSITSETPTPTSSFKLPKESPSPSSSFKSKNDSNSTPKESPSPSTSFKLPKESTSSEPFIGANSTRDGAASTRDQLEHVSLGRPKRSKNKKATRAKNLSSTLDEISTNDIIAPDANSIIQESTFAPITEEKAQATKRKISHGNQFQLPPILPKTNSNAVATTSQPVIVSSAASVVDKKPKMSSGIDDDLDDILSNPLIRSNSKSTKDKKNLDRQKRISKSSSLFNDDDHDVVDQKDSIKSVATAATTTSQPVIVEKTIVAENVTLDQLQPKKITTKKSLFDDDDDLLVTTKKQEQSPVEKKSTTTRKSNSSLFDHDDFGQPEKKPATTTKSATKASLSKKSLFDDDDDMDALLAPKSKSVKNSPTPSNVVVDNKSKSKSLFDDLDEKVKVDKSSPPPSGQPIAESKIKSTLFNDSNDSPIPIVKKSDPISQQPPSSSIVISSDSTSQPVIESTTAPVTKTITITATSESSIVESPQLPINDPIITRATTTTTTNNAGSPAEAKDPLDYSSTKSHTTESPFASPRKEIAEISLNVTSDLAEQPVVVTPSTISTTASVIPTAAPAPAVVVVADDIKAEQITPSQPSTTAVTSSLEDLTVKKSPAAEKKKLTGGDVDDLFSYQPSSSAGNKNKNEKKKKQSLFDDDDDVSSPSVPVTKPKKKSTGGSLFDDEDNEGAAPVAPKKKVVKKDMGSLFGDDDPFANVAPKKKIVKKKDTSNLFDF